MPTLQGLAGVLALNFRAPGQTAFLCSQGAGWDPCNPTAGGGGGAAYLGAADVTQPYAASPNLAAGAYYVVPVGGALDASWSAVIPGTNTGDQVPAGSLLLYDGTNFLVIGAGQPAPPSLTYRGNVDLSQPYVAPPVINVGDFYSVGTTTTADASWAAVVDKLSAGADVNAGDLLIWDGALFHIIANEVDLQVINGGAF